LEIPRPHASQTPSGPGSIGPLGRLYGHLWRSIIWHLRPQSCSESKQNDFFYYKPTSISL
jgi:hypothetical protein